MMIGTKFGEECVVNGHKWLWIGAKSDGTPNEGIYQFWTNVDDEAVPAVMCVCGNTRFEISYDHYACIANCPCGARLEIYSG